MPCPCCCPNRRVRRIRRSSVPCNSAIRSSSDLLVDIRPEIRYSSVECQPESISPGATCPTNADFGDGSDGLGVIGAGRVLGNFTLVGLSSSHALTQRLLHHRATRCMAATTEPAASGCPRLAVCGDSTIRGKEADVEGA